MVRSMISMSVESDVLEKIDPERLIDLPLLYEDVPGPSEVGLK